jgi:MFS superfamily sulfate permease-like transporter
MNQQSATTWHQRAWVHDFLASIVVFLVALPLCLGIAYACGAPPATGLITGIIGGIVVGSLAGCPLQVSGPAAGLIVIVAEIIREHGLAGMGLIVFMAGAIQLAAGLMKLGQVFRAVAPAVIRGMLAGIGVLIFASQFHVMVDDQPKSSGLQNLITIPVAISKSIVPLGGSNHHVAAAVGVLTIISLLLWQSLAPKKFRVIPAPLIAVEVATLTAWILGLQINYVDVPDRLTDAITLPTLAVARSAFTSSFILSAFVIAVVASAETLLCAAAVDRMQTGQRTRYDRELAAQGVGNMLCGALGALPMTGVIVRSSANVQAGGRTRLSAILHGLWLLAFVLALPWVLRQVPTACLAAILVYTGFKLMDFKAVKELAKYGRGEVAIYIVTLVTIVVFDLLTGVLAGIGLSLARLVYTFSHLQIRFIDDPSRNRATLDLEGAATFIRLPRLAAALEAVPPARELHVQLDHLTYIDHACLDLLMNWRKQHRATGGRLMINWESLTARFRGDQRSNLEQEENEPPTPARRTEPAGV